MAAMEQDPLPEIVRAWRKQRALTQEQAAEALGLSQTTISLIEAGNRPVNEATAAALVRAGVLTAEQYGEYVAGRLKRAVAAA